MCPPKTFKKKQKKTTLFERTDIFLWAFSTSEYSDELSLPEVTGFREFLHPWPLSSSCDTFYPIRSGSRRGGEIRSRGCRGGGRGGGQRGGWDHWDSLWTLTVNRKKSPFTRNKLRSWDVFQSPWLYLLLIGSVVPIRLDLAVGNQRVSVIIC